MSIAIIILLPCTTVIGPFFYSQSTVRPDAEVLVHRYGWISYDPAGLDPNSPVKPTEATVAREVELIRKAGFDGIITFGSQGILSSVPRLAKRAGLKVIMGIWDPSNDEEVATALGQQRYVDAYCVGHNGLGIRYSFRDLQQAVDKLRFYTLHPVSTTEPVQRYLEEARLRDIGDWLFPDVHLTFAYPSYSSGFSVDTDRDVDETFRLANKLAAATQATGKPILLKMSTYPVDGIAGASEVAQARYFSRVFDVRRDPYSRLSKNMAIAVHGAFDQPWKVGYPFYPWDPFTGLFDATGTPRPAVREITERMP